MTTPKIDIGADAIKDSSAVPERDLAAALLQLVLHDLEHPQRLCDHDDPVEVLQEARLFCFNSSPQWRRARENWCEMADVDPCYFQKQAIKRCSAHR